MQDFFLHKQARAFVRYSLTDIEVRRLSPAQPGLFAGDSSEVLATFDCSAVLKV